MNHQSISTLFIPYELALKAKEKGFNEICEAMYCPELMQCMWADRYTNSKIDELTKHPKIITVNTGTCTAPLYQQIIDWLFKEHGIWITIEDNQHVDLPDSGLEFYITVYGSCEVGRKSNGVFHNHNESLNKAIEEALKLI